jgi:hypothetical protein
LTAIASLLCCCEQDPCTCVDSWLACNVQQILRYRVDVNFSREFATRYFNPATGNIITHSGEANIWGSVHAHKQGSLQYNNILFRTADGTPLQQRLINIEARGTWSAPNGEFYSYDVTGKLLARSAITCAQVCPFTGAGLYCGNPLPNPLRDDFFLYLEAGPISYYPIEGTLTFYEPGNPPISGTIRGTTFHNGGGAGFNLGVGLVNSPLCEPFRCPHPGPDNQPTWGGCNGFRAPLGLGTPDLVISSPDLCDEDDPDCFGRPYRLPMMPICPRLGSGSIFDEPDRCLSSRTFSYGRTVTLPANPPNTFTTGNEFVAWSATRLSY